MPTLTVPEGQLGPFRHEARQTLEYAVEELHELVSWDAKGKRHATREELEQFRLKVDHAHELVAQLHDPPGERRVKGNRWALAQAIQGCLIRAGHEVQVACEGAETRASCADVRLTMSELSEWLELLEALGEAQEAEDDLGD